MLHLIMTIISEPMYVHLFTGVVIRKIYTQGIASPTENLLLLEFCSDIANGPERDVRKLRMDEESQN